MFVTVLSAKAINGNHTKYMSLSDLAEQEGKSRPLFSSESDSLTITEANKYLSHSDAQPKDGVNFEIVISLKDWDVYKRLSGTDEEARYETLRAAIRQGLEALFTDIGVREVRWVAAIHRNTDQPHVHVAVAPDCVNISTEARQLLNDLPRAYKLSKGEELSRAAWFFEEALKARQRPLPPSLVKTNHSTRPQSYVGQDLLPEKVQAGELGRRDLETALTYLTEEKEISPSIIQEQLEIGSIYAARFGHCVFVHRDAEGNVTGSTSRGKATGREGWYYIGDLRTATRYVLVDTPGEALSLYDLTKERDLSKVAFISLAWKTPDDSLLRLIAARTEPVRLVWARSLIEDGQQNTEGLEAARTALEEFSREANQNTPVEVVTHTPNRNYGGTWSAQLINEHMREELAAIERESQQRQLPTAEVQETGEERVSAEPSAAINESVERSSAEQVQSVEPATERRVADALASLPRVRTLPAEADILDGTRGFRLREAEREAARQRQEHEEAERLSQQNNSKAKSSSGSAKVETEELRRIPLADVLHAHGLRLRTVKGEKVYADASQHFVIKVTNDLFSDRKDSLLGGKGALDLVMHLQGVDFKQARTWLVDTFYGGKAVTRIARPQLKDVEDEPKPLRLYPANDNNLNAVREYLIEKRGLSKEIVEYGISIGTIYANSMKSCVFIHRDPEGHTTGAEWRSTDTNLRGTASGTEKQFGWFYLGDMRTALRYVVVEAPIDTLSYIELHKEGDISKTCFISLNGAAIPKTLLQYIASRAKEADGVELIWALDNNPVGKKSREAADKSFARTMQMLDELETGFLVNVQRDEPVEKDWNDQLLVSKGRKVFTAIEAKPATESEQSSVETASESNNAPNGIKRVRSRDNLLDDFSVEFNDGRYRWIGRANDEEHARQLATSYRSTLEARGDQVNDNGIYIKSVENVIIPIPKSLKARAHISVVQDSVDGRWHIGCDLQSSKSGWSYAPGVFRDSFDSRPLALRAAAAKMRVSIEGDRARSDLGENERRNLKRVVAAIRKFEAEQSINLPAASNTTYQRLPKTDKEVAEDFSYYKIVRRDVVAGDDAPWELYWSQTAWREDSSEDERAGAWVFIRGTHFQTAEAAEEIAQAHGLTNYAICGYRVPDRTFDRTESAEETRALISSLPDDELIERIENAPDFSYDEEEKELAQRLAKRGLNWRWTTEAASTGALNVIEAFPARSTNERDTQNNRGSEIIDAGVHGALEENGVRLSGGVEAEGVSTTDGGERARDSLRGDGRGNGSGAANDAGEGRELAGSPDSGTGANAGRSAGAGGLGVRGDGGRTSESGRIVSNEQQARSDANAVSDAPLIYARIINDEGTDAETRTAAYHHAQRAAETYELTILGRYVRGTAEQIASANNALDSLSARAHLAVLTHPDDILLARTTGLGDWELSLEDFIALRHVNAMQSFRRGIENNRKGLEELGERRTKRRNELEEQIRFWQRVVQNPEKHLEGNRKSYERAYEAIVRNAISKGFTVPEEIIATNPLFRTAKDARERYEKGRHTSFGNKSGIVDSSMQEERGYKVKRQDGKRITGEQVAEIAAAMDEIESVIGPVRDILRNGDVTIAHTNGKRPFLSTDAGGMYHPTERTITTGTCNRITGSRIPVQAHEFGHFLDDEAGAAQNIEVRIFNSGGRRSSRVVRYLSEADNRQFSSTHDENLIRDAKACMIRSREVERILTSKDKHADHDVQVAKEYLSVRVGLNYNSARETWARLFEQYISTKLEGRAEFSADSDYTNTLGFWKKEDFERFIPRIEAQIERRLALVRTALIPEAARAVTETEITESIHEQTPEQVAQVAIEEAREVLREEQPVIQLEAEPQTVLASDGRSETQLMFEQLLNSLPIGTSFEIAGESINGLSGRWVRVEEAGQPAWRAEQDGALNGHYRQSSDFYAVGVGDIKAEVNTLYTLIEETDGGIELLEQASIEAEYRTSSEETAPEVTEQATEEIPIAEGLVSESAYHRWLRSTHGCDHRRANDLSLNEQMRYRVQYLVARTRGEAPAQTGEDKESAAYRERLENALPQAIADDARYKGQKVTEISVRAHQRLRGVLDGFNSLDNKLTVEVQQQPVAEQTVGETRDISLEVAMKREAGREVIETLKNGDVIVEPSGNRWRVASAFTNSPDTTIEAAQLVCENRMLASILIRDPKGGYLPNNAEYFAGEAEVIRFADRVRQQIRREVGEDVEIVQAPFPVTEVSKLPIKVREHVDFHLARLRTADEQLRIAHEMDATHRSGTRYEDETWSKYKEESHESRKALTEFITNAMENDVDGSQVLEELGGFPQVVKARMMLDDAMERDRFETVPTRIIIDGNTVQPIIAAREREQLERDAISNAANVAATNEDYTSHWVRGDWPPVDEQAYFESPYGIEDDDPYVMLNEALRLQTQRKFFIPLAEQALESNIDPSTGRLFREKARKQFEHDLLEAQHSLESTFDEVDAVMGRACGEELRRRVEAVNARSKEALVSDTVRELAENEQAKIIFERNKRDPQNCVIALTRFIDDHISMGLSDEPTPVEVAEYNIALTTQGFFLEVAEKLHDVYTNNITVAEETEVQTSTPDEPHSGFLFDDSQAAAPPALSYLQIVGKSGQPVIPLTENHAVWGWKALNPELTLWGGITQNLEWQQRYLGDCGHLAREISAGTAQLLSAENVTVYRSGVSSITDLNGYADAGAAVGVVINRLSQPAVERLVEYNRDGGRVFIDSGAFGAFKGGTSINFDVVLSEYAPIFERMENKARVSLVMPDVVGDQVRSLELIREHRDAIIDFIAKGADTIIPIQRGEKSLSAAYKEIVDILGTDDFRVAIPSNQKAVPQDELSAFLSESKPARIHLLGISEANKRFSSLIATCTEASPGVEISADANRLRALVGANRKLTNAMAARLDEYAYQAVWEGDKKLVIEDETEAIYGIYNTPQYFTEEDALSFARYLTNDADEQRRIIEAAIDPDAPEDGDVRLAETEDAFDAPHKYGSRLGYVLEELFPGDRMYRWAIFEARQQMVREQLAGTEVPAAIRQQEITRIERDGHRANRQRTKTKPITYRQTEVYGERVVITDVNGNVRMPKYLEGRNIAPEVAQAANSLKNGQYFIVGNTFYVRCDDKVSGTHYQNFVPLLIMRESGASVYALDNFERRTGAAPRAAQEFASRLREDAETVRLLMSEVLDKEGLTGVSLEEQSYGADWPEKEIRRAEANPEPVAEEVTTQQMQAALPSNSEGIAFLRVVEGLGEPSEDYAGFNWNPMSDNRTLWFGPEEYLDWIVGKLESGMFKVEVINEDTFRSLTDQLDSQCYDRRGWQEIDWLRFYESRYYYSSEDPDPYLALDISIEEQQARALEILSGLEALNKNINPATGRPFKTKEREKFTKSLEETRDAFDGLYAEVYSCMGEHIEAELRRRVDASVGPLPDRVEAQTLANEQYDGVDVVEAESGVQHDLFTTEAENKGAQAEPAPQTIDASKLVFDPAGKPEHRDILDEYFEAVAREDSIGHQGLPRIERALVHFVRTRGFTSVREPSGNIADLDDGYRRLRLHLGEEQREGESFSNYTARTNFKENLILLARCVYDGDREKAQSFISQVEKYRAELSEDDAKAMQESANEVSAAERAARPPKAELKQQEQRAWDSLLDGTWPGDEFYVLNEDTGARLMRVVAEPNWYSLYVRLRVVEILATEKADLEIVENYLDTPIDVIRKKLNSEDMHVVLSHEETNVLEAITHYERQAARRIAPAYYLWLKATHGVSPQDEIALSQEQRVGYRVEYLAARAKGLAPQQHGESEIGAAIREDLESNLLAEVEAYRKHEGRVTIASLEARAKLRGTLESLTEIDRRLGPDGEAITQAYNKARYEAGSALLKTLRNGDHVIDEYGRLWNVQSAVVQYVGGPKVNVEAAQLVCVNQKLDNVIFRGPDGAYITNSAANLYAGTKEVFRAEEIEQAVKPEQSRTEQQQQAAQPQQQRTQTTDDDSELQPSLFSSQQDDVRPVETQRVKTDADRASAQPKAEADTEQSAREETARASKEPPANAAELTAELKAQIEKAQAVREARGTNFVIEDVAIHDGGAKQRFKWNVAAIETLHLIESEERAATDEEKQILARFSGFGSMPGAFNKYSDDAGQWNKERDQIKRLLTEEEFEAASRSTLNAHYTHPSVVDAIWKTIGRMGFEGGRVLEPAMGSGVFFGRIPKEMRDNVQLTGVELDSITGRIAKLLYPQADIHNTGFQNVNPPDGWFDLAISNVPFGSYNVHDPEYNKYNAHIHDYFILKSLDKVRDGGLVVEITSMGTMDKQDSRIREKIAEKADLVAAVRLPCTAFEKNAGTQVVTDILIFQKRAPIEKRLAHGEKLLRQAEEISANANLKLQRASQPDLYLQSVVSAAREDAETARKNLERAQQHVEWLRAGGTNGVNWTGVTLVDDPAGGEPIVVNQYFADNPEMIVGTLDRTGSMYHGENVNVHLEEGQNLDTELYYALSNVPRYIYEADEQKFDAGGIERIVTHNEKIKAGGYVVEEGKLFQRVKDVLVKCEASADRIARITRLLEIRDTVRTLFNHELAGEMEAAAEVRSRLNKEYDRFVGRYGHIHANKNVQALQGDPDLPVLLALESKYTPGTSKKAARATKADIFTKPTLRGYQPPTTASNINEALSITLNEYGRLNIGRICGLLERDEKEVGAELLATGLAYKNPRGGAWEIRDEYLSGNVRAKLTEAREAAKDDPSFEANAKALETVIPEDVDYVDIGVRLGSSWVPTNDIADFMAHLVGGERSDFTVKYAALTGSWTIGYSKEGAAKHRFKPAAVEIWGTDRADLIDVVQHACDARAIVVRDRVEKDKYIVNKEETEAANAKLAAVKAEFKEWIWTDSDRRERLHRYYNDHFNNIAPKLFDGSHLTFPGMNPAVKLRKNQVDAIWRTITTGKAIYAHKVGRGKTYTMIAAAMEMKRLGLVEKPCIACLKGNIGEITAAAQYLYPGARILSTLGNFEKAQRKEIVAHMATGDYDLIIMTHDNLDMLPMYPETRAKYIKEELKELEETIYAAAVASGKDSNRLVKTLENAKAKLEADMLEILEKNKDDAVNFEETGIDFLFVDEFHKYKALKVYTKQDRVKGIPTSRSDRATNMLARIRWLLEQHDGRGAVGATGTPISNTTAELFNLMRYYQWDELNERGIRSFDAWASVFGETVTKIERTATGSYKEVTRFAKFTNLPELIQLSHQVMDVCMEDVPEIKLPKRIDEVITSDLSDEQQMYLLELQQRAEDLKGKYIKEKGADNMLAISNDARKMSLDMRLVSPEAADDPNNKVNSCVKDVLRNLRERPDITQLVFSDMGVHENDWGFSVYKDLKEKLVAGGLKPEEVIDFSKLTERQRKQAIEDLATGKAKVGIGSTDKLGTGTNVQYHLYANHNLDVHWLPSSQLQRDGRIERQGNKHADLGEPIRIKRYVTVGGFDEIMYTAVDRKIKFINQIMQGDVNGVGREFVEVDGEELSAAQIAAIASGNPDVLRKVELEDEVGQLERSERRHKQSQLRLEDDARDMVNRVGLHEQAIERLNADSETLRAATTDEKGEKKEGFFAEIQEREYTKRKEAGEALERAFNAARDGDVLGTYKGFPICVRRAESFGSLFTEMYLAGKYGQYEVNFATAEGIFTSMDSSLRNIERQKISNEEQIRVLKTNSEKIKGEIGKPFKDADRLKELRAELVQVEKRLRDAGVADGTNVKTGRLTFEKCEYEVELRNHGVVKELRPYAKNGGTVIKIDNKPVGWLKQDDEGALVAIEIKQEYRRHGVATRAVTELYKGNEFKCYAPDEQGAAWLNSISEHTVDEETGLLNVKLIPREQPEAVQEEGAVIVGYQTRIAISREEQVLARYAEQTRLAEEGYREITGRELSSEARLIFGRMMLECSQSKPTGEQEEMIQVLMDEQGLDERPEIIENQVDAAIWIARRRNDIDTNQLWVRAAMAAAQEASDEAVETPKTDVGKYHRGTGADRSYGVSLALDAPITRENTAGRETVDVNYVPIPKEKIFDPRGLIAGTNVEQSQDDRDTLAARLVAAKLPDRDQDAETYVGYHTTVPDKAPDKNDFIQRGDGLYLALDAPFEMEGGVVSRKAVDIDPQKIFDPNGCLEGTDVARSRRDFERLAELESEELKNVNIDAFMVAEGRRGLAKIHTKVLQSLGYEAEVGYINDDDSDKRELVIFDRSRVRDVGETPLIAEENATDATDATARERTRILKELGYEAEARTVDGVEGAGKRELIVFEPQSVRTLERDVPPASVVKRAPEWKERAETAYRQEQENPDRVVSGREVVARYTLEHAEYQHRAAIEQTDLRRYVVNFDGDKRRISVRDIENLSKSIAHRQTSLRFEEEFAKQQELPIVERKPARVVRQELQEQLTAEELSRHADTIQKLREMHGAVVSELESKLNSATSEYAEAVVEAVEVAELNEMKMPRPIIPAKLLDELHDDAVDRKDAHAIIALDELRQNLIAEFGEDVERTERASARLAAQHHLAELSERVSERTLRKFEETYHLRRFEIEGHDRNAYLPERPGAEDHNQQEDHTWSLKDVAKARLTVKHSREWLLRNAEFYDRSTDFLNFMGRLADQHFNPVTQWKLQAQIITDPKRYFGYHLNPVRQLESNPVVQTLRFVKNYGHAKEHAEECRRLAEVEETKLESLDEIEIGIKSQIDAQRQELTEDLTEQAQIKSALDTSLSHEIGNREARALEMPSPEFKEHEIRRIEAQAMELQDGNLLMEYEALAGAAKAKNLLIDELLPEHAVGRETVAEARTINAQLRLDVLDKEIPNPTAAPEGTEAQVLKVRDVTQVRVNIEGEDRVMSVREAAVEPEEVQEAVRGALSEYEERLGAELQEAAQFHDAATRIADAYRSETVARGITELKPQLNVKEHLEIERFAAGVEDEAIHERFSQIARSALDEGRVIGIERSHTLATDQSATVQAETAEIETDAFEQALDASDITHSEQAVNALFRAAQGGATALNAGGNGNGLNGQTPASGNGDLMQTQMQPPGTVAGDVRSMELGANEPLPGASSAEATATAEVAEAEAAAQAIESIELIL